MSSPRKQGGTRPESEAGVRGLRFAWVSEETQAQAETSVLCTQDRPFLQTPAEERQRTPLCGPHTEPRQRGQTQSEKAELRSETRTEAPEADRSRGAVADTQGNRVPACTLAGGGEQSPSKRPGRPRRAAAGRPGRRPLHKTHAWGSPNCQARGHTGRLRGSGQEPPEETRHPRAMRRPRWGTGRDEGLSTKAKDTCPIKHGPQPLRRTGRPEEAQARGPPSPQASCSRTRGICDPGVSGLLPAPVWS